MLSDRLSVFFFLLLASAAGLFAWWGLGYTGHSNTLIFLLATAFGLFMAFNIGGNDVANSFGTSVGAGTLTIKQALVVAAIFEVSGALIAGGAVTDTIRKGIVDLGTLTAEPEFNVMDFLYIMMSALLAAAVWLLVATRQGWPVSTTHSIIGGIVGSSIALGWVAAGMGEALSLVHWNQIGTIAISWVLSPVLGGLGSYVIYYYIRKHILTYNEKAHEQLQALKQRKKDLRKEHKTITERMTELQQIAYTGALARDAASARSIEDANEDDFESDYYKELHRLEREKEDIDAHKALVLYVPLVAAAGSMIITAMLLYKGLKNLKLESTDLQNGLIVLMVAAAVWMAVYILARTQRSGSLEKSTFLLFSWMQVFTAAGFAFSHGSNDIANAIGPFAAILDVLHSGEINPKAPVPTAAMVTFGVALIAGLWFIGKEVIRTVGTELTRMHPASGFTAELAAASVVLIASTLGLPVSSTHILVGAVLGIGLVNRSTNWSLMKPIAAAWVITLPAAALLSAACFLLMRAVL
ncbi:phosphate permease [Parahaliea maris]|uniref:Phosphate transporter n=1 Tax=Parahaliea maris TaxID=2716870 RepID=A0A5C8ZRB4_9GAMM|nr:inorganic phosphate transporter [Parahaliea maris]TXS89881.1 phosphate permease [Parahaliea maris]